MGLRSSVYWTSWILNSCFFTVLATSITMIIANIMQFDLILDTSFGIVWLLIFIFSMSMQIFGYFLTTLISTVKTGNSITYAIFLAGFFMQGILGNPNVVILFWTKDLVWWG